MFIYIIEAIKGNKKPRIKNNNSLDYNILFRVTDIYIEYIIKVVQIIVDKSNVHFKIASNIQ